MAALGVDGIVGLNTQKDHTAIGAALVESGHANDAALLAHFSATHGGGVSGAPIAVKARAQIGAAAKIIARKGLSLQLVHVGGISTREDAMKSRALGDLHVAGSARCDEDDERELVVPLREWYTGYMRALGAVPKAKVYADMAR